MTLVLKSLLDELIEVAKAGPEMVHVVHYRTEQEALCHQWAKIWTHVGETNESTRSLRNHKVVFHTQTLVFPFHLS
jgi:hypothetical protein